MWWRISKATWEQHLVGVPGVNHGKPSSATVLVHDSHLPLITSGCPKSPVTQTHDVALRSAESWMRPWQVSGARRLQEIQRGFLLDSPRVGKTVTSLLAHDPRLGPLEIIAPLNTRGVWRYWVGKLFPTARVVEATGLEPNPLDGDVIFIHHEILRARASVRQVGTLIVDEAHFFSNYGAAKTEALTVRAANSVQCFFLTGTPIWNSLKHLYSMLNIVVPGAFGSYKSYVMRYCGGVATPWGVEPTTPTNRDELTKRLEAISVRRTWQELSSAFAPTVRRIVSVTPTAEELTSFYVKVAEAHSTSTIGTIAINRKMIGMSKVRGAVEAIPPGEPCVVWVWHREVGKALKAALKGRAFGPLDGEGSVTKRQKILDDWRNSSDGVLILSLLVGQVGIDLSHARVCVFAELDWTPAVIAQAEMRTFSVERATQAFYVVTEHAVESLLVDKLLAKVQVAISLGLDSPDTPATILKEPEITGNPLYTLREDLDVDS